jgi:hypothetical protein
MLRGEFPKAHFLRRRDSRTCLSTVMAQESLVISVLELTMIMKIIFNLPKDHAQLS